MVRTRPPVPLVLGLGLGCILLLAGVQSATPGLRPDDGDLEVGGAGRNTTCAVNSTQGGKDAAAAGGGAEAKASTPPKAASGGAKAAHASAKVTPPLKKEAKEALVVWEEDKYVLKVPFEELYLNATEAGDSDAQYWLGRVFEAGLTESDDEDDDLLEKDINQAAGLYLSSMNGGNADAACALGMLYADHDDPDKAAETFLKAAELGSVEAVSRLGMLYDDAGHSEDALTLYTQAAEAGDPLGQSKLAACLLAGKGVEKDVKAAGRLFTAAAEMGEPSAHGGLGMLYEAGLIGGKVDLEKAAKHYREGAEGGDKASAKELSRCLRLGLGVEVNHEMADAVEPELDETERLAAGVKQMEEELAGAKKAGVLAGGRPSRYTYLTTYFRQQTEEERVAEEKEGWDGSYPFLEDTVARYRYARNDVYYKQPGVVLKPVAKAA